MMRTSLRTLLMATAVLAAPLAGAVQAQTIVPGFNGNALPANDDGSTGLVNLGFNFNFYGQNHTQAYVNNNGNITFTSPLSTFTPFGIVNSAQQIIAPFFADVDTRGNGSGLVTYGTGTYETHNAFGVNWLNVGYFGAHVDKLNNFQLLLVDRSDLGVGDADIYFNYGSMQWETGDASGGSGGLGGSCARVGYSNGAGVSVELPGTGVCGALINGGANELRSATNDGVPGQYLFQVRGGEVVSNDVPEPASLAIVGIGLAALGAARRRR